MVTPLLLVASLPSPLPTSGTPITSPHLVRRLQISRTSPSPSSPALHPHLYYLFHQLPGISEYSNPLCDILVSFAYGQQPHPQHPPMVKISPIFVSFHKDSSFLSLSSPTKSNSRFASPCLVMAHSKYFQHLLCAPMTLVLCSLRFTPFALYARHRFFR